MTQQTLSRRHALRLLAAASAAALVPARALRPMPASAARVWCRTDPQLLVDGLVANLYVSGLVDTTYDTAGPIRIDVRVPLGVETAVLATDAGFGYGYDLRFVEDKGLKAAPKEVQVVAEVYVPATAAGKGQPIRVEWVPDGTVLVAASKEGTTNQWISASTKLKRVV